ncbi:MAG TPA: hypothetical protein GXX40_04780 [Firmicutes bacterium]|nr:hypothetical protein [Bacillota bacterium]
MEERTLIGVFDSRSHAERAVTELQKRGLTSDEISIVARDDRARREQGEGGQTTGLTGGVGGGQDLSEGTYTGGVLGGLAGLLAGVGALAIPGIGPIVAAGPIAATLTGAVGGGLAGGLIDWGIPEERGRYYEGKVKEGEILAIVKASREKVDDAADVFRRNGAHDVEVH